MSYEEIEQVRAGFAESVGTAVTEALSKRGFDARYFPTSESALGAVLDTIPEGATVGAGGSVTLRELGVLEKLEERDNHLVYHKSGMEPAENLKARKDAITCQYYLSSSNAITMEGELVNTDGIGNRVCGMIFGPETVVVLAGVNKVVADREEAFSRIKNVAAPANARRLGIDVPCVKKGRCVDCQSPMNICRVTTIISRKPFWTNLVVFMIGENLGL